MSTTASVLRNPYLVPEEERPTLRELARTGADCRACALHTHRSRVVFGAGPADAELMVVGEAPGRQDDLTGNTLTGAVGNVLDNAMSDAGLRRDEVYVTTLVKCMPPALREPTRDEIRPCSFHLFQQIAVVRPRVIVTLGEYPTRMLLQRDLPVARISGYRFEVFGHATLIPTWSPNVAMRGNPRAAKAIRRDLAMAAAVLSGRVRGAEAVQPAGV